MFRGGYRKNTTPGMRVIGVTRYQAILATGRRKKGKLIGRKAKDLNTPNRNFE